jgi:hypothetical protein
MVLLVMEKEKTSIPKKLLRMKTIFMGIAAGIAKKIEMNIKSKKMRKKRM